MRIEEESELKSFSNTGPLKFSCESMNGTSVINSVSNYLGTSWCELDGLRSAFYDAVGKNSKKMFEMIRPSSNLFLEKLGLVLSWYLRETKLVFSSTVWIRKDLHRPYSLLIKHSDVKRPRTDYGRSDNNSTGSGAPRRNPHAPPPQPVAGPSIRGASSEETTSSSGDSREVLFVMGGCERVHSVETLDPVRGSWAAHVLRDAPNRWTWICNVDNNILVLETDNQTFRSFNVLTQVWTSLPVPSICMYGTAKASSDHHVYVMGGNDPDSRSCVRFDVGENRWDEIPPMRESRSWAAAVCHAGNVYCCGGYFGDTVDDLASLESFNGEEWVSLAPMAISRNEHSLVSCGRFLWAVGGLNHTACLAAVERYDVEQNQWMNVRELPLPMFGFSTSVLNGGIYVIGGKVGNPESETVCSVYVYNEDRNRWDPAPPLHLERYLHGSCVVNFSTAADADMYAGAWPPASTSRPEPQPLNLVVHSHQQ